MVCVLLELRSSSKLPKGHAMSAKAANELVSLKMWLKWNVLKRNEVESDWITAQSRSRSRSKVVWKSKGGKPQQRKENLRFKESKENCPHT